ncbi:hypothetical protein IWW55_000315 [Coemansia sp. RSA 2706]|nr:hypothetical protein LPJ63_001948 [Coemansia sp. RSA 2711]KAJ2308645.1 hypothetical protein IWW55_000315 [Coemansia sp. RSA 2706]KAJ2315302.1 hypothetical protein IWW54_000376 [Coemansia sp. RSA 2705]KAJ2321862.1 hypothetical protein IWW52_000462 [Coemansia sp. RSA 2704]KAJ2329749.1 hypothetical protein IWW51_000405 [Coemansia sp. RSA 2702]KAJ2369777.1 hypothetical protein H4S01_000787 [Coemansia sp. RSA 2610]KAJ2385535.1 hypothetical protein H4S02_004279 [Coemansia sp. RSA 2611]KAJ273042
MDGGSYEGMRSPVRPWGQPTTPQAASPRTPQSAYSSRQLSGRPAAHTSLAALEAKNSALQQPPQPPALHLRGDGEDKWRRLGARILPVFTGERLHCTIEECNEVVRSCLRSSEQLDQVWPEIHGILRMGMASVVRILYRQVGVAPKYEARANSSMVAMPSAGLLVEGVRADVLVEALAFVWELVYSHVLPFVEGVFLPLVQFGIASSSRGLCVRSAMLMHFRDKVVMPVMAAIEECVGMARAGIQVPCLASVVHMMTMLAALNPLEHGVVYQTARALSAILQA